MCNVSLIIVILVLFTEKVLTYSEFECPVACKCHSNDMFCVGDGISSIPTDISWKIMTYYFRNYSLENKILSSSYINGTNITELLTMDNIGIEHIEDGAFATLSKLQILDLDNNYLTSLNGEVFQGLTELRELYLCKNRLVNVENAFVYLENLNFLDLSGNFISQLTSTMFNGIKRYLQLILSSNNITNLSGEGIIIDTYFSKIDLSNNPLNKSGIELVTANAFYIDLSQVGYRSIPFISAALTGLSLSNNRIKRILNIDSAKLWGDYRRFRHLNLENNAISWIQYESLASFESLSVLYLSNNRLTNISFQIPQALRELYLDGNQIKEIPAFSFSNATRIRLLTLANNEIEALYPCSFCSLGELSVLNLKNNLIEVIPEGAFMSLDILYNLYLQNNKIKKIESGSFIGIRRLSEINLSFLTLNIDFDEDVFDDLETISVLRMQNSPYLARKFLGNPRVYRKLTEIVILDISYNNLSQLDNSVSTTFRRLRSVDLSVNLWNCDIRLLWLSNWMKLKPHIFLFSDDLNCSFPREMLSTPIASFSDLHHQLTTQSSSSSFENQHELSYYDVFTTITLPTTSDSYTRMSDLYPFTWEIEKVPSFGRHHIEKEDKMNRNFIRSYPSIGIIFGYSVLGVVIFVLCIIGTTFGFSFYHRKRHWFSKSTRFPRFLFGNGGKGITVGYENVITGEQDLLNFDN